MNIVQLTNMCTLDQINLKLEPKGEKKIVNASCTKVLADCDKI